MTDGLLGDCKPDPLVRGHISDPVIDAVKEAVAARSRDSAEQDAAKIDATLAAALELKYAGKILAHAAARANEAQMHAEPFGGFIAWCGEQSTHDARFCPLPIRPGMAAAYLHHLQQGQAPMTSSAADWRGESQTRLKGYAGLRGARDTPATLDLIEAVSTGRRFVSLSGSSMSPSVVSSKAAMPARRAFIRLRASSGVTRRADTSSAPGTTDIR